MTTTKYWLTRIVISLILASALVSVLKYPVSCGRTPQRLKVISSSEHAKIFNERYSVLYKPYLYVCLYGSVVWSSFAREGKIYLYDNQTNEIINEGYITDPIIELVISASNDSIKIHLESSKRQPSLDSPWVVPRHR